jgi:hypothetical protein
VTVVWVLVAAGAAIAFLTLRPLPSSCTTLLRAADAAQAEGWRSPLLGWEEGRGWRRDRLEAFLKRCHHENGPELVTAVGDVRELLPPPAQAGPWVRQTDRLKRELDDIPAALRGACGQ